MRKIFAAALLLSATGIMTGPCALAQPSKKDMMTIQPSPIHKFYVGSATDGAIFSTATLQRPGYSNSMGTLRFSYFINIGATINYDFSKHAGIYAGLDLKNIGFIEKKGDLTIKHRTYNLGVPLGLKFGNLGSRTFFFAGAGCDAPINYREKEFAHRGDKHKFNEWFSDATPALMPYIFAGISVSPGVTFKLQYYLNNYLNPDYVSSEYSLIGVPTKIYAGYDVHLMMLSVGLSMPYHHHHLDFKDMKEHKKEII